MRSLKLGLAMPGQHEQDLISSAKSASAYNFESFSVYGDDGDMPPMEALQYCAPYLADSQIAMVGPMGITACSASLAVTMSQIDSFASVVGSKAYMGLVRGVNFAEPLGSKVTFNELRTVLQDVQSHSTIPIRLGGYGAKLLQLACITNVHSVKIGGSANPKLAAYAKSIIANDSVKIVLGAVTVIDSDRRSARLRARQEVGKYIYVVGALDPTLNQDQKNSLHNFISAYKNNHMTAYAQISDELLDLFAVAGTADDVIRMLAKFNNSAVDCFELGTPHGLHARPDAIDVIGKYILPSIGLKDEV